ncbi:MAG: DUF1294 domain-containing protein [Clostridia bacterium]|nr:DUF1294 domain-containing protein [Clostridia bacterium]
MGVISLISVLFCAADKLAAIKGRRRISERCLFTLSFLGGAAAMYITMRLIRHKTLHKRFMIGLPIIIALQITLFYLLVDKNII